MLLHIIVYFITALMLLWAFMTIVVIQHTTNAIVREDELLGGANYLPCDYCRLPKREYPNEGYRLILSLHATTLIAS